MITDCFVFILVNSYCLTESLIVHFKQIQKSFSILKWTASLQSACCPSTLQTDLWLQLVNHESTVFNCNYHPHVSIIIPRFQIISIPTVAGNSKEEFIKEGEKSSYRYLNEPQRMKIRNEISTVKPFELANGWELFVQKLLDYSWEQ